SAGTQEPMATWTFKWSSLRRVTSDGSYIAEIDGLRFIAILSVLLFHIGRMTEINFGNYVPSGNALADFLPTMLFHGGRGVELFFAISGMILGMPFAKHYLLGERAVDLKKYFIRRLTRLEPPYIVNLLMRLPLIAGAKHMTFREVLPHFFASLFYLHGMIYATWPVVHPPSWSLEIEVQFYILAPLFALLAFRHGAVVRRTIFACIIVGASILQARVSPQDARFHLSILEFVQYFLVGFLLADLYVTSFSKWKASWIWDVASVPMWLAIFHLADNTAHFVLPVLTFVVYVGAFKGKLINFILRTPLVSTIGGMCYSIYLTHSLVLQGVYVVFRKAPLLQGFYEHLLVGMALITPVLIAFGALFFVLVERPCMDKNWPRKLANWFNARRDSREVALPTEA
ncbi:MAG TPA: acyltransferase, partial [Candidatus Acidoferrum sp.]|nr:acyltransferase [Candidatus Acidoferrum sp.]